MKDEKTKVLLYKRFAPEQPQLPKYYMSSILQKFNIDFDNPRHRLFSDWKELDSSEVIKHTKPSDIKNGVLILFCDNGAWASLFNMQKNKVLKLVNQKYPSLGIKSIKLIILS